MILYIFITPWIIKFYGKSIKNLFKINLKNIILLLIYLSYQAKFAGSSFVTYNLKTTQLILAKKQQSIPHSSNIYSNIKIYQNKDL